MKDIISTIKPRALIPFGILLFAMLACSSEDNSSASVEKAIKTQELVEPATVKTETATRPNIMLVVVDDMGFNDLGIYGGEIGTPNIDALANDGVLFSDFNVAPNCSPTRAMLLSGADSHIAGMGNMFEELAENQKGKPGYEGYLNTRVAAMPELFRDAGYHTYMTGKWHLGLADHNGPDDRGFDRSFSLLQGGAGAFSNMLAIFGPEKARYAEDGKVLDSLPEDFYSTKYQAEKMLEYIDSNHGDGKPFFSYLAFTSPHWPLQAPQESIARHKGKYDAGYDVLKARRLQALKKRGLVAEDVQAFPRFPGEKAWDELTEEEQRYQAKLMEIYAAMVEDVDIYLGKVITHLKEIGEYDNTFIFFTSDNGPEAHHLTAGWKGLQAYIDQCCDNSVENIGNANSYVWYGQNWGQAGNTPLRQYKGYPAQGGVRVPAFAHYPAGIETGKKNDSMLTAKDVMPTLLELAGIQHPGQQYKGREVADMSGESMLAMLKGERDSAHERDYVMGWELFGKRALRQGDWKIIYQPYHEVRNPVHEGIKTGIWQLYNLAEDPVEMNDLAEQHPEKLAEMLAHWKNYEQENGVIFPDTTSGY
jgi:arylsulfatase A-like enzyme